ncbi:eukaryotic translation initiation factor 2, variant 2 [Dermatophagoides farinae]|uniref:Eukaryotic translation initiation factor 2 subunit 2 n=1 Tax=Dermatophagoides farinae TaxID=6954 RepID=A0A922LCK2_DERFA|nr:eukaryotic translation initiation factor 2, variant 2 [Dermatophagoides farinae]
MADDELDLDLTTKKKKKTKKPYDFTALDDEESSVKTESVNDSNVATETKTNDVPLDDDLDLADFSGLKKKKKKKKPFNLEELENALPSESGEKESPGDEKPDDSQATEAVDDFDLDFSVSKKKKKKKKTTFDLPDQDDFDKENDADADDDLKEDIQFSGGPSKWLDSDRDYTYDELLEMIYNKIKKRILKVNLEVEKNMFYVLHKLHRQSKHLQNFLLTELGTSGSVDANNQLIIKGRFQQKQIESVLRRYIKEYVACQTCRSPETILQKETRLFFLQCESCGSRRSVANIKSGFQAVTGRRSAMRARTN